MRRPEHVHTCRAITKSDTPNSLVGVIAHEAGHIAGGHLRAAQVQIARMQSAALIMNLIGIGADGRRRGVGRRQRYWRGGRRCLRRHAFIQRRSSPIGASRNLGRSGGVSYLNGPSNQTAGMSNLPDSSPTSRWSVNFIDRMSRAIRCRRTHRPASRSGPAQPYFARRTRLPCNSGMTWSGRNWKPPHQQEQRPYVLRKYPEGTRPAGALRSAIVPYSPQAARRGQ